MKKIIFCILITALISYTTKKPSNQIEKATELNVKIISNDTLAHEIRVSIKEKINNTFIRIAKDYKLNTEKDLNVHIWKNYDEYLLGQEKYMGAKYPGTLGYIFSLNDIAIFYNDTFLENLEHEYVHTATLHLNESFGNNPRWLWESAAIYESNEFINPKEIDFLMNGDFPSLKELNGMIDQEGAYKIYQVGYLLSEFIVEKWGRIKFLELIKESGDLKKVLSISEQDFEKEWKKSLMNKYFN